MALCTNMQNLIFFDFLLLRIGINNFQFYFVFYLVKDIDAIIDFYFIFS
jgi:hypothetical protein